MDQVITQLHTARALLHDMEPSSSCWPVLAAKVDELERAAMAKADPRKPDVPEMPSAEVDSPFRSPVLTLTFAVSLACFPWVVVGLVIVKRWLL